MKNPNQTNYRVAIMSNGSTTPAMVRSVLAYDFIEVLEAMQDELTAFQNNRGRYLRKLTIDVEIFDNSMIEGFAKPRKRR